MYENIDMTEQTYIMFLEFTVINPLTVYLSFPCRHSIIDAQSTFEHHFKDSL